MCRSGASHSRKRGPTIESTAVVTRVDTDQSLRFVHTSERPATSPLTKLKIVVLAQMPSASASIANTVKPEAFESFVEPCEIM